MELPQLDKPTARSALVKSRAQSVNSPMWAGFSNRPQHVHLRLPGMAGSTVQLRFEFAQDRSGIGTDVRPTHTDCGISVDNIVMNSVVSGRRNLEGDQRQITGLTNYPAGAGR